ncbi:MAG: alpha/beta hydrolase, partial [Chloroflexi bacterium]
QIDPLASAGLRVVAPDQRGYNLSDKPAGLAAYRLEECANDVVHLIQALGRQKAAIVGHDWGGFVAWWLGINYPEVVEKLVILNAPHPKVVQRILPFDPPQWLRSLYVLFFQLTGLAEAVLRANDWELLVEGLQKTSRPGTFTGKDIEQYRRAWWKKGAMTGMLNWYRANFRMPPSLPANVRIPVPTLMLWGAKDTALGRELAQPSIELCDQGKLIFFEEATHWLQHEEVEKVNQHLIGFLKQI